MWKLRWRCRNYCSQSGLFRKVVLLECAFPRWSSAERWGSGDGGGAPLRRAAAQVRRVTRAAPRARARLSSGMCLSQPTAPPDRFTLFYFPTERNHRCDIPIFTQKPARNANAITARVRRASSPSLLLKPFPSIPKWQDEGSGAARESASDRAVLFLSSVSLYKCYASWARSGHDEVHLLLHELSPVLCPGAHVTRDTTPLHCEYPCCSLPDVLHGTSL